MWIVSWIDTVPLCAAERDHARVPQNPDPPATHCGADSGMSTRAIGSGSDRDGMGQRSRHTGACPVADYG